MSFVFHDSSNSIRRVFLSNEGAQRVLESVGTNYGAQRCKRLCGHVVGYVIQGNCRLRQSHRLIYFPVPAEKKS